jgi:hypothetical protein
MTRLEFLRRLGSYERQNLWKKGILIRGPQPTTEFGYGLVYEDRDAAALDFRGRRLGCVQWHDDVVSFDPPVAGRRDFPTITDEDLDRWVSFAYTRSLTAPDNSGLP